MRVRVFTVEKSENKEIEAMLKGYEKMIKGFASLEFVRVFDKNIQATQKQSAESARDAYEKGYLEHFSSGYNIALAESGKNPDSHEFSSIIADRAAINFFIGGAYGFGESFLKKADFVLSLGRMTFAHKIAKLVLVEQIYRGLAIKNGHPYHK